MMLELETVPQRIMMLHRALIKKTNVFTVSFFNDDINLKQASIDACFPVEYISLSIIFK